MKEKLRNKKTKKKKEKEKPTNKRVGCANYRDIQRTHIYSSITIYDFHFVQYLILRREKGRERTRKREKGRERERERRRLRVSIDNEIRVMVGGKNDTPRHIYILYDRI